MRKLEEPKSTIVNSGSRMIKVSKAWLRMVNDGHGWSRMVNYGQGGSWMVQESQGSSKFKLCIKYVSVMIQVCFNQASSIVQA